MKSKRTMKYHEKPRHYFMAVAALINQGFKTCFLSFFACFVVHREPPLVGRRTPQTLYKKKQNLTAIVVAVVVVVVQS